MNLEGILKNWKKKLAVGASSLVLGLSLACGGGGSGGSIPIDAEVDINENETGMIEGRIEIAAIDNNKLIWEGQKGIKVEIDGTSYSTSSQIGGLYSFDGIPAGTYTIEAFSLSYGFGSTSVLVRRQDVGTANIQIDPSVHSDNQVLYGKVFENNKTTPASNKEAVLYRDVFSHPFEGSTIISSDGSYAIYAGNHQFIMKVEGQPTKFITPFGDNVSTKYISGITKMNVYIDD